MSAEHTRQNYEKAAAAAEKADKEVGPPSITEQMNRGFRLERKDNSILPLPPLLLFKSFVAEWRRSNLYANGQAEALKLNDEYVRLKNDAEEKIAQAQQAIETQKNFEKDRLGMKESN